ncbi:porin family protein [Rhodobacterales bacterium]|nr:porin family protein [Rhodobacterales bacterium]
MKLHVASFAAALLLCGAAHAENLFPAGDVPSTSINWTGAHVGANVGYGWGNADASNVKVGGQSYNYTGSNPDPDGFMGGVQVGYDYQFTNGVVLGVETDFSFSGLEDKNEENDEVSVKYLGTARARLGYAFGRFLPYATAGLAYGQGEFESYYQQNNTTYKDENWQVGWTAGAGADYAITENVSLKLEYLYTDLGDATYEITNPDGWRISSDIDSSFNTVKVGLNYRF